MMGGVAARRDFVLAQPAHTHYIIYDFHTIAITSTGLAHYVIADTSSRLAWHFLASVVHFFYQ